MESAPTASLGPLGLLVLIAAIGITVFLGSRLFSRVAIRAPRTVRWTRLLLCAVIVAAVVIFFGSGLKVLPPSMEPSSRQTSIVVDREAPPPKQLEISPRRRDSDTPVEHRADDRTYAFVYRVPDSFEDWKKSLVDFEDFETVAANLGVPNWVLNAADSKYEPLEIPGKIFIESRAPGESNALVGYRMHEPDRRDAETRAFRAAADQLVAAVVWHLRDSTDNLHDATVLALEIVFERQDTLRDGLFTETFRRPISGELYWSAVRVKADESTIESLSSAVKEGLESGRLEDIRAQRVIVEKLFSAFGLALCAFLIYCFLNAGTKGHFAWPLRIISFGGLVAILVLAFIA